MSQLTRTTSPAKEAKSTQIEDLLLTLFDDKTFVDYFNVFLCLPIFGQRVLYKHIDKSFIFQPTVHQAVRKHRVLRWLSEERYPLFTHTVLAREYWLCCKLRHINFALRLHDHDENGQTPGMLRTFSANLLGSVAGMCLFRQYLQDKTGARVLACSMHVQLFHQTCELKRRRQQLADIMRLFLNDAAVTKLKRGQTRDLLAVEMLSFDMTPVTGVAIGHRVTVCEVDPSSPHALRRVQHALVEALRLYWVPSYILHVLATEPFHVIKKLFKASPDDEVDEESLKDLINRCAMFSTSTLLQSVQCSSPSDTSPSDLGLISLTGMPGEHSEDLAVLFPGLWESSLTQLPVQQVVPPEGEAFPNSGDYPHEGEGASSSGISREHGLIDRSARVDELDMTSAIGQTRQPGNNFSLRQPLPPIGPTENEGNKGLGSNNNASRQRRITASRPKTSPGGETSHRRRSSSRPKSSPRPQRRSNDSDRPAAAERANSDDNSDYCDVDCGLTLSEKEAVEILLRSTVNAGIERAVKELKGKQYEMKPMNLLLTHFVFGSRNLQRDQPKTERRALCLLACDQLVTSPFRAYLEQRREKLHLDYLDFWCAVRQCQQLDTLCHPRHGLGVEESAELAWRQQQLMTRVTECFLLDHRRLLLSPELKLRLLSELNKNTRSPLVYATQDVLSNVLVIPATQFILQDIQIFRTSMFRVNSPPIGLRYRRRAACELQGLLALGMAGASIPLCRPEKEPATSPERPASVSRDPSRDTPPNPWAEEPVENVDCDWEKVNVSRDKTAHIKTLGVLMEQHRMLAFQYLILIHQDLRPTPVCDVGLLSQMVWSNYGSLHIPYCRPVYNPLAAMTFPWNRENARVLNKLYLAAGLKPPGWRPQPADLPTPRHTVIGRGRSTVIEKTVEGEDGLDRQVEGVDVLSAAAASKSLCRLPKPPNKVTGPGASQSRSSSSLLADSIKKHLPSASCSKATHKANSKDPLDFLASMGAVPLKRPPKPRDVSDCLRSEDQYWHFSMFLVANKAENMLPLHYSRAVQVARDMAEGPDRERLLEVIQQRFLYDGGERLECLARSTVKRLRNAESLTLEDAVKVQRAAKCFLQKEWFPSYIKVWPTEEMAEQQYKTPVSEESFMVCSESEMSGDSIPRTGLGADATKADEASESPMSVCEVVKPARRWLDNTCYIDHRFLSPKKLAPDDADADDGPAGEMKQKDRQGQPGDGDVISTSLLRTSGLMDTPRPPEPDSQAAPRKVVTVSPSGTEVFLFRPQLKDRRVPGEKRGVEVMKRYRFFKRSKLETKQQKTTKMALGMWKLVIALRKMSRALQKLRQMTQSVHDPLEGRLFEEYLVREVARAEATGEERTTVPWSDRPVFSRKLSLKPATTIQVNRLADDLRFWREIDKYREQHWIHLNTEEICPSASARANTLISCYLASPYPPTVQVNVPEDIAQKVADRMKRVGPCMDLFFVAYMRLVPILYQHWEQFSDDWLEKLGRLSGPLAGRRGHWPGSYNDYIQFFPKRIYAESGSVISRLWGGEKENAANYRITFSIVEGQCVLPPAQAPKLTRQEKLIWKKKYGAARESVSRLSLPPIRSKHNLCTDAEPSGRASRGAAAAETPDSRTLKLPPVTGRKPAPSPEDVATSGQAAKGSGAAQSARSGIVSPRQTSPRGQFLPRLGRPSLPRPGEPAPLPGPSGSQAQAQAQPQPQPQTQTQTQAHSAKGRREPKLAGNDRDTDQEWRAGGAETEASTSTRHTSLMDVMEQMTAHRRPMSHATTLAAMDIFVHRAMWPKPPKMKAAWRWSLGQGSAVGSEKRLRREWKTLARDLRVMELFGPSEMARELAPLTGVLSLVGRDHALNQRWMQQVSQLVDALVQSRLLRGGQQIAHPSFRPLHHGR